ncbi:MAG: FtsK/SpoIIIE domain-containing protein [Defluviitaleaceae bacterium]|nr:FtsK/SpoIIIE domain-containing protein [Defluviitaleaceae bacterium]
MDITYQTILRLINDINTFAEQSDQKIQQLWDNFNNSKNRLEGQYNQFMERVSKEFENNTSVTRKKATALKENADKIYQEVLTLDASLANTDKYYIKTRVKKEEELAQETKASIIDEVDIFVALEKAKVQYKEISSKYSREILPAIINDVNYIFSKQRKQDYEELIVLKNTLGKLMEEIKKVIPELINDSTQIDKESHNKKAAEINSKYNTELDIVNARYEKNVEVMANEICEQLDVILPDNLLHFIKEINQNYKKNFYDICSTYKTWDGTIVIGFIDYPLELFVSSNILFSLIKDKCSAILAQNKLLRFPLVFSLKNNMNLLIKYSQDEKLKKQFISSIIHSFISAVPVTYLSIHVIDTESQGENRSLFADFSKMLPDLFNNGIITSNSEAGNTLEKLAVHIKDSPKVNFEETPLIKLLIVFDSPESLGRKNVALINNIIDNGSEHGVYTIIGFNSTTSRQTENSVPPFHEKGCIVIQQAVDMFLYYNLRVTYNEALTGNDLSKYIMDYLLLHYSFKGNITLLDPALWELITSKNPDETHQVITSIKDSLEKYDDSLGFVKVMDGSFPSSIPVGTLSYPLNLIGDPAINMLLKEELSLPNTDSFNLPAIFNLNEKSNLLLTYPEALQQYMGKFIHNLMWCFLSSLPVGKINFCIFDAERRGNSITPFLDFRQKMPEIFDTHIYTAQDAMLARLQKLNKYIDEFIQDKLGNRYSNIIEYNANTPNRAEPITLLIIFDFPRNFDSRNIELLINILSNGSKCGIYTIICNNPNITFSKYESIDEHLNEIKKHCSLVEYTDKYVLQPYGLPVDIAPELSRERVATFIQEYANLNTAMKQKGLSFEDIINTPFFTASSAERLSIPIGIGDGESIINFVLGEGSSHHGLITGATGSGKTVLLHTLIMSSMLCHSPEELHLYLMDFKGGTEFKIYESTKLPHIQLLAIDAMQEFGESILEDLVNEISRRSELFKNAGQSKLKDYVDKTGKALPRILVIMDEFQILYNDSTNRKIAMNCAELTKRIVTEGRSYGIHLLMATQSTKVINGLTLDKGVIEQMRIRIGMKCGEDDVRYLFGYENSDKVLEMMKGPIGTAVINMDYTEMKNNGFRVAYCSQNMQTEYLSHISEKFAESTSSMQIFEGNRTVLFEDYLLKNNISIAEESVIKMHMGTLIKVAPPFVMIFDRRRRHNLLICGANEKMAENLTNLCSLSTLLNSNANIYCIDGESLIGESVSSAIYDCLTGFTSRFKTAKNRAEIISFINEIYSIYIDRKKNSEIKQTLIVIKNLQFLDIIKTMLKGESIDENEFVDNAAPNPSPQFADFGVSGNFGSMPSISEKLLKLIDDGSNYGIYFIVSSLDFQNVKENMYYGENVLSKFPERIIFSLNNNDADNLIDGVSVSGLRDNTVYYSDGVKSAFQFKPYIMPDASELNRYLKTLTVSGKID